MGAPARIPTPAVQLRSFLADLQQAGDVFDHAWAVAWRKIQWPHDTDHRRQWKSALAWAREEFRLAYDGEPSMRQASVAVLDRTPVH